MSNLIGRLRGYAGDDHERGCQGRYYTCSCGYDDKRDPLLVEAADEITRLTAENKKLRAALKPFADAARPHKNPTPDFARALEVYDSTALQQEVK